MSISVTRTDLFDVYKPYWELIKEVLPLVLVCGVLIFIVVFLFDWTLNPVKVGNGTQSEATQGSTDE